MMGSYANFWSVLGIGLFFLLLVDFSHSELIDYGGLDFEPRARNSITYSYERTEEVKKQCAFVLSSASELKPDDNRMLSIKQDLTFLNGDWWQESNGAPLMPFDDRDSKSSPEPRYPMNLVSFWITDVDRDRRSKKFVSVSGFLQMGITVEALFLEKPYERNPHFDIWPDHSQLSVSFEGIYTESKENNGERVLCLLGNTMLPSHQQDSSDPWEWVKESGYTNQPPLVQDDQILLVLHYPITSTVTSRAIRGSMKSLNARSNLKYFDEVRLSSWLGTSSNYNFGSEKVVSQACDPYPYEDSFLSSDIDIYKGLDFCVILQRFTHQEPLTVVPNWKCNGTDDYCSKLGPFMSSGEIKATNGSFKDVKIVLQDVRCEKMPTKGNEGSIRVSSVVRAVPPYEKQFTAAHRTGLNNMTLFAEGIWKSSSGQLCMVGCRDNAHTEGNGCDSRICLYVPLSFSIKQRSIIVGTISSIDASSKSYFPLSFEKLVRPSELWDQYTDSHAYYKYSKSKAAVAVLEKNEPTSLGSMFKKALLTFPKLEDADSFLVSLSLLSEDLTIQLPAVSDLISDRVSQRTEIAMEIVSLGPLFGHYGSAKNGSATEKDSSYHSRAEFSQKQLLLNVSAQLSFTGRLYSNFSTLFLEGLYDELVGKMYLIGCRDARASWQILHESMDLEAGLDCLIEVVISYPPTTSRWLVNPSAKISISSQRNEDDPLYFSSVSFQTFPVMYRKQREDILSRRSMEGILRIVTLSLAIVFILSQLFYIRDNLELVPYISLVMLGFQALGYSLPLITGAEALFKKMGTGANESPSYDLVNSQWIRVIDYTVKILVLAAFLITLRLCQKVWKSRVRLLTREPHHVPSDKQVFIMTLIIHAVGYIIVLITHASSDVTRKPLRAERYVDSTGHLQTLRGWETELEEYSGLIQDFFLLPQIIGNFIWQINCKPLRNLYYIGITSLRLLPHLYDYIRSPVSNPYFSEEYEFVNPRLDFYTTFGDIAIPVVMVLLTAIVYIQQRWSYEKLSQTLKLGSIRLLPQPSKAYERLPSASFEAELSSAVSKDHDPE